LSFHVSVGDCDFGHNSNLCLCKIMEKYNKLVRDKIPDLIAGKGESTETHVADDVEFEEKLHAKLREEVEEFLQSESIEELADIFEVTDAIMELHGFDAGEVKGVQEKKRNERGGFKKRIILDSTG